MNMMSLQAQRAATMAAQADLELHQLVKRYGIGLKGPMAVDHIGLTVKAGAYCCLLAGC